MITKVDKIYRERILEASCLICDDVRKEIRRKRTLVGVIPTKFTVQKFPHVMFMPNLIVKLSFLSDRIPDNLIFYFKYMTVKDEAFNENTTEIEWSPIFDGKAVTKTFFITCPVISIEYETDLVLSVSIEDVEYEISRHHFSLD